MKKNFVIAMLLGSSSAYIMNIPKNTPDTTPVLPTQSKIISIDKNPKPIVHPATGQTSLLQALSMPNDRTAKKIIRSQSKPYTMFTTANNKGEFPFELAVAREWVDVALMLAKKMPEDALRKQLHKSVDLYINNTIQKITIYHDILELEDAFGDKSKASSDNKQAYKQLRKITDKIMKSK